MMKLFLLILLMLPVSASAERIKDLASIRGVRDNQLLGYGLVVGLDGSGDQTTQTPFTVQSIITMLAQMGVNLPAGTYNVYCPVPGHEGKGMKSNLTFE